MLSLQRGNPARPQIPLLHAPLTNYNGGGGKSGGKASRGDDMDRGTGPPKSRLEAIATRWTLLRRAHGQSATAAGDARDILVMRYQSAIRRYIGALVHNEQEADDITQDVLIRLLKGDFAGADPCRGRFRDLLKVAIRNMVRNTWNREKVRRAVNVDVAEVAEVVNGHDDEDESRWLAEWRHSVVSLTWTALERDERLHPAGMVHTILRLRTDYPDESSDQLAERLSVAVGQTVRPDAARQKLRRARLQFVDLLLTEVANGLDQPDPERIEEELIELGLMEMVRKYLPADWKERRRPG
jgi:RNA polymerase sigma factor (sigma-70 family)